jgi:signal transduction histidine kinase
VVGYTEMLMDGIGGPVNPDQRDMLTRIRRNGQRLMVLIEDLLTASRLESGTTRLELGDLDLRTCAGEALDNLQPLLRDRDLAVELVLDAEPLVVLADAAQIERLLANLLGNAVKFTPDGGSVTVTVGRAGRLATLAVADTGMGVPEDEQDQLFSRFFRSSTAQRRAIPGTGIGLSIVRAIASQHGGSVSAVSKEGVGSTFTLSLPLQGAVTPIPPALLPLAAELGGRSRPAATRERPDEGDQ